MQADPAAGVERIVKAIPKDRCERCTSLLDGEAYKAERDRVCSVCATRAEARGETVERVCPACLGEPLPPTDGPDGRPILGRCGACTPLPAHAQALLDVESS